MACEINRRRRHPLPELNHRCTSEHTQSAQFRRLSTGLFSPGLFSLGCTTRVLGLSQRSPAFEMDVNRHHINSLDLPMLTLSYHPPPRRPLPIQPRRPRSIFPQLFTSAASKHSSGPTKHLHPKHPPNRYLNP